MKTDLNNEILKSLVTTLQGQVDALKAENAALQLNDWGPTPIAPPFPEADLGFPIPKGLTGDGWYTNPWFEAELHRSDQENIDLQSANLKFKARIDDLERERTALNTENIDLRKKYSDKEAIEHNTAHLWNESDKLVEENGKLLKDNTKLAKKVRLIESGNFDEFFTYTTSPISLASGETATTNISITREADFYLTKIVRENTGSFAFLVRESSNDRQWSNIPLHSNLGAGTAEHPLILPKPRFVARASTLTVELTNLEIFAIEVRLAFIGYKVYHVENLYHATGKEKKASKAAAYDEQGSSFSRSSWGNANS